MITKQILKNISKKELLKALNKACGVDRDPLELILEVKGYKLKNEKADIVVNDAPDNEPTSDVPSIDTNDTTDGTTTDNVLSGSSSPEAGVQIEGSSSSSS